MNRTKLIEDIRNLLNPDPRPEVVVFRAINNKNEMFLYNGETLTLEQCKTIPAKMQIFVRRRSTNPITHEQTN